MPWELVSTILKFLRDVLLRPSAGKAEWIKLGNRIFDTEEPIDLDVTMVVGHGDGKPVRISIHREPRDVTGPPEAAGAAHP